MSFALLHADKQKREAEAKAKKDAKDRQLLESSIRHGAPAPAAYCLELKRDVVAPYTEQVMDTASQKERMEKRLEELQLLRAARDASTTLDVPPPFSMPPPPPSMRESTTLRLRANTGPLPPPPDMLSPGRKVTEPPPKPADLLSPRDSNATPRTAAKSKAQQVSGQPVPTSAITGDELEDLVGPPRATSDFPPHIRAMLKQSVNVWGATPANSAMCKTKEDLRDPDDPVVPVEASPPLPANNTRPQSEQDPELRAAEESWKHETSSNKHDTLDESIRHFLQPPQDLPRDGKPDLVAVFFGEQEPGSRPPSGSPNSSGSTVSEHLSWEQALKQQKHSSNSPVASGVTSPLELSHDRVRRASGVMPDGITPTEDNSNVKVQLTSIMRITGDKLCRRGACCYKTEAACSGRPGRQGTELTLSSSNPTGTMVRSRRVGGSSILGTDHYVHKYDALDQDDEACQMEYCAALCFLIACEKTPDMGRRSDEILVKVQLFVESNQSEHALRANRNESKHCFELGRYLAAQKKPPLISNGALIAAALYLGLAKIEDFDLYQGPWLPIYIYDATAAVTVPPAEPAPSALSLSDKGLLQRSTSTQSLQFRTAGSTLRVEDKQAKRTSNAGSTLARFFGSSKGDPK
jgi:hypothetical protein